MKIEIKNGKIAESLSDLKDGDYTIEKLKKKRTNGQNRHFHGPVLGQLSEAMTRLSGKKVSREMAKEIVKFKFLQFFDDKIGTFIIPTSKLTTVQWIKFLEDIQRYGSLVLGIDIESPNEVDYSQIEKN
jgi:hypothetical protein